MRKRFLWLGAAAVLTVFLLSSTLTDEGRKDEVLIDLVVQGIRSNHYTDIDIDNTYSEKVYELFLKNIDYGKNFFTQEDIESFESYRYKLDNEANARSLEFMDLALNVFKDRVEQVQGYTEEIMSEPFNFERIENIETDPEKRGYAGNRDALKEQWRKYLKFQVLTRLADKLQEQKDAQEKNDTTVEIKTQVELEKEIREKVLKTNQDWFHRLLRQERDDYRSVYLNAFAAAFDPHTSYYPPKEKENFDISMSGQLEGIGAQLREEGSYIKVSSIVPGGPAWKQGDLQAGQLILKVAQGAEEPVDIVDMPVGDAVRLIRGPKGTEVRLTVKKVDGTITVISIIRDVVILDETYAKSALLKKGDNKQVGYISLPKFYADFSHSGGRNSSTDVKNEVLKLKAEGISGLIIDLRNNGGGSLQDVVDMVGLFIKTGPVVQVKGREGAPYLLQDNNPEVVYDGPLVIMVNEFSASASEIMAAAIQDYGRGIIIGSDNTFGKGTVQRFFDLDDFVSPEYSDVKPLGVIKMTTQKFYRINGKTTQLRGVHSDIVLPDAYAFMDVGEKDEDYPLEWDIISPCDYDVWNNGSSNFAQASKNSEERVSGNKLFALALENAERLKKLRESTTYSLHLGLYQENEEKRIAESKKYDAISEDIPDLQVFTPKPDQAVMAADSSKKERVEDWHKNIRKDIYINETLCVVQDMIDLPKHPVTDNNK